MPRSRLRIFYIFRRIEYSLLFNFSTHQTLTLQSEAFHFSSLQAVDTKCTNVVTHRFRLTQTRLILKVQWSFLHPSCLMSHLYCSSSCMAWCSWGCLLMWLFKLFMLVVAKSQLQHLANGERMEDK